MKLIDILVQELPKRGGWPDGSTRCMQTDGMYITFPDIGDHCDFVAKCMAEGVRIATREQYEAALAAAQPQWDGEGLPPVGCVCEIKRIADWTPVTINFISDYHTVFTSLGGTEYCYLTCSLQFRPIRSEADKKRDEAVKAMIKHKDDFKHDETYYHAIYDAIVAGKIPHVHIE